MIGITGATGVLGNILTRQLEKDNLPYSPFGGDLRNSEEIRDWLKSAQPTEIIHFAARVPVNIVDRNPAEAFEVNVMGTLNLVRAIVEYNSDIWFFFSSTSHVYASSQSPISEESPLHPQTIYGETKLIAEELIQFYVRHMGVHACIGRIFSFYDKRQRPPFLYPSIVSRLKKHDKTLPFDVCNGQDVRDILKAEEVIGAILGLRERGYRGLTNIGSGKATRIIDFVQKIIGPDVLATSKQEREPTLLVADISRLETIFSAS